MTRISVVPAPRTPQEVLDDLRERLRRTRFPDHPADSGWTMGTDVDYMRELVATWAEGYDHSAYEDGLARWTHVRAELHGHAVHAIHRPAAASAAGEPIPLLLCHGWPDSTWRYVPVIDRLADPVAHDANAADAFHVVVPDMPGYGYSTVGEGIPDSRAVAAMWVELMEGLGYERFAVAGGDIGSHVARFMATTFPERLIAVHRIDGGMPRGFGADATSLSPAEREWVATTNAWRAKEGGYAIMHRTKPQTLAMALADSPAGLAAWIVEKLQSWGDTGGDVESAFSRDAILALVTEYWVTGCIGSSMRMYRANTAIPDEAWAPRIEVPCGYSVFPVDIAPPPREWLERTSNLVYLSHPERGGHFAPIEQPQIYADELRTFLRAFR